MVRSGQHGTSNRGRDSRSEAAPTIHPQLQGQRRSNDSAPGPGAGGRVLRDDGNRRDRRRSCAPEFTTLRSLLAG
jgi:hypothetical protein